MNSRAGDSGPRAATVPSALCLRLTLLAYLVSVAAGLVLLFYSVIFFRAELLAGAVLLAVIAWTARSVLRQHSPASLDGEMAFEEEGGCPGGEGEVESGPTAGLVRSLREWAALEQARGSPDFDPWALQSARRDVLGAIEADPALERLFRGRF